MKSIQIILVLFVTLSSANTFAQKVVIGGDATQSVTADNITNFAGGISSTADQILASIRGGVKVTGNVKQTISAKNITNLAMGVKSEATQLISSIDSH